MPAIYGPRDRAALATTADHLTAAGAMTSSLPGTIADRLRHELPDLDDLTIGRVLIAATITMAPTWEPVTDGRIPPHTLWQGLAAAGLTMTEPEWKD